MATAEGGPHGGGRGGCGCSRGTDLGCMKWGEEKRGAVGMQASPEDLSEEVEDRPR